MLPARRCMITRELTTQIEQASEIDESVATEMPIAEERTPICIPLRKVSREMDMPSFETIAPAQTHSRSQMSLVIRWSRGRAELSKTWSLGLSRHQTHIAVATGSVVSHFTLILRTGAFHLDTYFYDA